MQSDEYYSQLFYVIPKEILTQDKYIIGICFEALNITEYLVYFSLEYIYQIAHAHREAIVSECTKFNNNSFHVLASGGKPYSIAPHV